MFGDLTLQSVAGQLYYVAPLEHSSLFKWLTNHEGAMVNVKNYSTVAIGHSLQYFLYQQKVLEKQL